MKDNEINFYIGRRKSSVKVSNSKFDLGNVLSIDTSTQDWQLKIVYKSPKEFHEAPTGLEGFINKIGTDIGRVKDESDKNSGTIISLNSKYNIHIKYTD
jgi:hypothetical protein